jgi:hypothetical protein
MLSYCTEVYSCILWNLNFFQIKSSRTEDQKFGKVTCDLCRENRTKISNIPSFLWSVSWVQNIFMELSREDWILRGPHSSSFWVPRNLSNHMVWQVRTGDTELKDRDDIPLYLEGKKWFLNWYGYNLPSRATHRLATRWSGAAAHWSDLISFQKLVLTVREEINRLLDYQHWAIQC